MENEVYDAEAIARLNSRSLRDGVTGCLVHCGAKRNGYVIMAYRGQTHLAHRFAYYAHRGPIPKGLFVCHTCDNRACIEIAHLFLGSPKENVEDMRRKGRYRKPTMLHFGRPSIDEAIAAEVKRRIGLGQSGPRIAQEMGGPVTQQIVSQIRRGVTWRNVKPAEAPL
jgi:hypothetical protein